MRPTPGTSPAGRPGWPTGRWSWSRERGSSSRPWAACTVRFAPPNPYGILDHDVTLPSGETVNNPVRVIPNGDGCDVIFTVHRRDGVTAEAFAADTDAVAADLATLRDLLQRT